MCIYIYVMKLFFSVYRTLDPTQDVGMAIVSVGLGTGYHPVTETLEKVNMISYIKQLNNIGDLY